MLRKLLKYEFMSNVRQLGLIYILILAVSVVMGLSGRHSMLEFASDTTGTGNWWPFIISILVYVSLVIASVVITLLMVIKRFYDNMLGGEGYLTHTLPVATWKHLTAKTISAFTWEVLGCIVFILSAIIALVVSGAWGAMADEIELNVLLSTLDGEWGAIICTIIASLIQLVRITLMFYAAMAIGGAFSKNKGLFSFFAFLAIMVVINIIDGIIALLPFGNGSNMITTLYEAADSSGMTAVQFQGIVGWQMAVDIIFCVILFAVANYFLKKKLNLA